MKYLIIILVVIKTVELIWLYKYLKKKWVSWLRIRKFKKEYKFLQLKKTYDEQ